MKLLHIYGDVMNLYGEYANVRVLERYLSELGDEVVTDTLSLYEEKDISGYDFYYMGAGTERNQKLALSRLMHYRAALQAACAAGKVMLFTGNACELLGASVTDAEGKTFEALGIGDFTTTEGKTRITGDCLAKLGEDIAVGFINKCSRTDGISTPLFTLLMGYGNTGARGDEGFVKNNCFGTHITGPILAKNPFFLRKLARLLLGDAFSETACDPYMENAYRITLNELTKRLESAK